MTPGADEIHVLLVDDEVDFLAATSTALKRRSFRVSTAPNGDMALLALQRKTIDVVVLDVKMPGMSGDELFRILASRWPDIPVLMLTGHGSFQHAFKSSKDGVLEYLAKPCDMERLATALRDVVAQKISREAGRDTDSADREISVLVVDDEQELLDAIVQLLDRRGMKVVTARNSPRAFEQLCVGDVDVVLLDVKLQGENGIDVLEKIRSLYPSVEVILQTGQPSAESAVEGLRKGAFDYLAKPIMSERLLAGIRAAYKRRRRRVKETEKRMIQDILEKHPD